MLQKRSHSYSLEKIKTLLFSRLLRGRLAFVFEGGKPLICPQVTHKTKVTQAKFFFFFFLIQGNLIAKCNTNSFKLHIFPVIESL